MKRKKRRMKFNKCMYYNFYTFCIYTIPPFSTSIILHEMLKWLRLKLKTNSLLQRLLDKLGCCKT